MVIQGLHGPTHLEVFSYSEVAAGKARAEPTGHYTVADALKAFTGSSTPPKKPSPPSGDLLKDSLIPGDEEHRPTMSWHLQNGSPADGFTIEKGSTRVVPENELSLSPCSSRPNSPTPAPRRPPTPRHAFTPLAVNPVISASSHGDAEIENPHLTVDQGMPTFQPLSTVAERPEFTPRPAGGFPKIHGDRPFSLFANQPASQRQAWSNMSGPKLGIQVYDEDASNPTDAVRLAGTLAATIERIFNIKNVAIATPQVDSPPTSANSPPFTFLAHGFSRDIAAAMLHQGTYSSRLITFHVFKICWTLPRFICGFSGFTSTDELAIKVAIRNALQEEHAIELITDLVSGNPHFRHVTTGNAFYRVLNSLEITVIDNRLPGGFRAPIVNIYMDSPTVDPAKWIVWRNFVFSLKISTDFLGTATGMPNRPCTGCHSADHPRGLCPFPNIPGWNGPGSTSYANNHQPNGNQSRGRSITRGSQSRSRPGRGRGTPY